MISEESARRASDPSERVSTTSLEPGLSSSQRVDGSEREEVGEVAKGVEEADEVVPDGTGRLSTGDKELRVDGGRTSASSKGE